MALTLWERFTHWVTKDFFTLEERALMLAEAERLALKTRLQEERINKRREREERARSDFRTVAVWNISCVMYSGKDKTPVNQQFYLQQTKDPVNGKHFRRIKGGPTVRRDNGKGVMRESELGSFEKGLPEYINYVLPWHEWTIDTEALQGAKNIKILGKTK